MKFAVQKDFDVRGFASTLWPLLVANLVFWAFIPALSFGNLHTDTLEAAYWGRDLALGYTKHPPLVTWLITAALIPGSAPVLTILLLGQLLAIISAFFTYDAVRRIAGGPRGLIAASMMLLTSTATFYAPQVNHNSVLIPFCAAALSIGLRFIKELRLKDAALLGVVSGLGALTKFEIAFALIPLLFLSIAVPEYRPALRSSKTLAAALIALVIFSPNLYWQNQNSWPSFVRAVSSTPLYGGEEHILLGLSGVLGGLLATMGGPVVLLLALRFELASLAMNVNQLNARQKIGRTLVIAPIAFIIVAAIVTNQSIKPLWVLPLAPSLIAGVALLVNWKHDRLLLETSRIARIGSKISAGIFLAYVIFLSIGEAVDIPSEAYLANTQLISIEAEKFWASHSSEPLRCIVTDEHKLGISPVIWLASRPQIIPIRIPSWATQSRLADCSKSGAIAIAFEIEEPIDLKRTFPAACVADEKKIHLGTVSGIARTGWNAALIYIPPSANATCDTYQ